MFKESSYSSKQYFSLFFLGCGAASFYGFNRTCENEERDNCENIIVTYLQNSTVIQATLGENKYFYFKLLRAESVNVSSALLVENIVHKGNY